MNISLLGHALEQSGPWQGKAILKSTKWFINELKIRIGKIRWQEAKQDVARFLRPRELASLEVWSEEFFLSRVDKLAEYLA